MFFSILSLTIFIIALVWLIIALRRTDSGVGHVLKLRRQYFKNTQEIISQNGWSSQPALRRLSYFFSLNIVLILAFTGFFQPWFFAHSMSGLLLMLHLAVAPLYAISLLVFVLFWERSKRFISGESRTDRYLKMCFWVIAFFSATSLVSAGLMMLPLAGTPGQMILLAVHKCSAIILLVFVMVHIYFINTGSKEK